jgi:hypothetical protein
MFERLKRLVGSKPVPVFSDPVLGSLVSKHCGTWCGEIAFEGRRIGLIIPGDRRCPDKARLEHARTLILRLAEFVEKALGFAAQRQKESEWQAENNWTPKPADNDLEFVAVNYHSGTSAGDFALDFVQLTDKSGNCWEVHFRDGRPVEFEYT